MSIVDRGAVRKVVVVVLLLQVVNDFLRLVMARLCVFPRLSFSFAFFQFRSGLKLTLAQTKESLYFIPKKENRIVDDDHSV